MDKKTSLGFAAFTCCLDERHLPPIKITLSRISSLLTLADAIAVFALLVMLASYGCQKVENNDVLRVNDAVQIGWTIAQCKAAYAPKKNLTVTQGKPPHKTDNGDFVMVLRLKNHLVLSENTYLTMVFKNDVLTEKYYLAFYRPFD